MTQGKVKLYRNPERKKPDNMSVHTPFYQQAGIEPQQYVSPTAPSYHSGQPRKAPLSTDNPRAPRPAFRQPYADPSPSPVGRGRGLLPNVGNNLEQTWSSVDGNIIDDLSENFDPNAIVVDNNDYVSAEALGLPPEGEELAAEVEEVADEPAPEEIMIKSERTLIAGDLQNETLINVIQQLEEDEYLLMVEGECICSGSLEDVQTHARGLAFGEHPLCDGQPVPIDNILVLKRVPVKVGLFLS
jgi:hypothetical protein